MVDRRTLDEAVSATASATPPDDLASGHIDQAVDRRPWQFSLRVLMVFTAAVACVVWLATVKGAGVLVVVIGLAVSILNWRGALAAWQRPDRCGRPIKLGWLLLLVSLFLPCMKGCHETWILGWEAAQGCAGAQIGVISNGVHSSKDGLEYIFFTFINLTNLLLLASPLLLVLLRRGRGQGYAAALACGATAAWTVSASYAGAMLIGYYVWCLGQLLVLSAARLGPRTLAAMVVVAFVRVFFWPEP